MDSDHYKALALLGHIMPLEILGLLVRKGILTSNDAKDAIDRCLLNLETNAVLAERPDIVPTALARQICETALAQLDAQDRGHRG